MLDGFGFIEWLRKGPERAPMLYGGKVTHKPVEVARNVSQGLKQGIVEPLGKQMFEDRKEFDRKQATADHDDDLNRESREVIGLPGIPVDWDAKED